MRKSLAALGPVALGCLAMTCAACASGPEHGPGGPGGPGGPDGAPPMAPGLFVSPFGEPFRSEPGEPYPVAAWFAGADTDHDGKLTRAEFMDDGVRWFGKLDVNRDGVIGQAEIVAYEAMAAQLGGGMRGPGGPGGAPGGPGGGGWGGRPGGGLSFAGNDQASIQDGGMGMPGGGMGGPGGGGRGGPRGGGGEGPRSGGPRGGGAATSILAMAGLLNVPEPVKAADVDINQRITPEEWSRAGDRWFDLLDTDKDGGLTLSELPQTQLQQGGGMGRGGRGGRGGPPR
ncbi:EF-hand domain-containing protein [Brevundimonas goettingensis]|uniref:EF-hand domain-containing protein n=1 Tax=Brevundimonas goettingensis TaxID=2774190 RepID=A0A975C131_9CAUL|nr:EF-hand domain-containing protein [Brevundimonas goettingensis]QTC90484.1 EF-hand domain-containing protein [Brevundimonas goettingensis]